MNIVQTSNQIRQAGDKIIQENPIRTRLMLLAVVIAASILVYVKSKE